MEKKNEKSVGKKNANQTPFKYSNNFKCKKLITAKSRKAQRGCVRMRKNE